MEVLYEKNADTRRPMASMTKIMTLIVAGDMLESGFLDMDDTVTFSAGAVGIDGVRLRVPVGERLSVRECIQAAALPSANDAAIALAEHIAGREARFVDYMNNKASRLALAHTRFVNCHGLDADGHYSTARDMAVLSAALLRYRDIAPILSLPSAGIHENRRILFSTNLLLGKYDGLIGMKTGTTTKAKNCFSATAVRGGVTLVAVVMGCPRPEGRFTDAAALLDYGFARYDGAMGERLFSRLLVLRGQLKPRLEEDEGTVPFGAFAARGAWRLP
jgi:D-alanyl-D-alanine carboxypeptidase (penicillin-binding protein 5/6)